MSSLTNTIDSILIEQKIENNNKEILKLKEEIISLKVLIRKLLKV